MSFFSLPASRVGDLSVSKPVGKHSFSLLYSTPSTVCHFTLGDICFVHDPIVGGAHSVAMSFPTRVSRAQGCIFLSGHPECNCWPYSMCDLNFTG